MNEKNISRLFAWSLLEQISSRGAAMIVQIVLARLLVPEVFGIMAILLVLIEVLNTIAQSGLGMALIQRTQVSNQSFSTAFWMSLMLSVLLYICILIFSPYIAKFYQIAELESYLKLLGIVVLINSFNSIQRSYLQRNMNFKSLFVSNTIAVVISGVLGICLAAIGFGVWALIIQSIAQALVACILMCVFVPWKPSFCFSREEAAGLFDYGWKICFTGILNTLYTGLSELVLGRVSSASDLGYYSNGRKWPNALIAAVTGALQNVLFPRMSQLKDYPESFQAAFKKALVAGTFAIVGVTFYLTLAAESLVYLVLGEPWLPCVLIFQLACLGNSVVMIQIVNLRSYMALGDAGLYLRLQVVKVLTGIVFICGAAVLFRDIYIVAIATFAHGLFSVFVVDLNPANRMLAFGRWKQIKLVAPIFATAFIAAIPTAAIALTNLPEIIIVILQTLSFCLIYFGLSAATHQDGLLFCLECLKGILGRKSSTKFERNK